MQDLFQKAKRCYTAGDYATAFNISYELLEEGIRTAENFALSAKSFLFLMSFPLEEDDRETFYKAVTFAATETKSIEELYEIEYDIISALVEWENKTRKEQLKKIEESSKEAVYSAYREYISIGYPTEYITMRIATRRIFRTHAEEKWKKGGVFDDFRPKELPERLSAEDIRLIEYRTAIRMFAFAKQQLAEFGRSTHEVLSEVAKDTLYRLAVSENFIDAAIREIEEDEATKCERLKTQAELISYRLNALISVVDGTGEAFSLLGNEEAREKEISKLVDIYAKVKELDSDFVVPALPDKEGIHPSEKSGGCYVATAVYGSYDCPQVWTLRRFRDYTLAKTWYGRAFIRSYYAISPTLVKWFGHTEWFKALWRGRLDKMVTKLNSDGVKDTSYEDKVW